MVLAADQWGIVWGLRLWVFARVWPPASTLLWLLTLADPLANATPLLLIVLSEVTPVTWFQFAAAAAIAVGSPVETGREHSVDNLYVRT